MILILGSQGMVGRIVHKYLASVFPMVVGSAKHFQDFNDFQSQIGEQKFAAVINCIGILRASTYSAREMVQFNAVFPLELSAWCTQHRIKLIHISTDAVYSNLVGAVSERAAVAAEDSYAMSKYLGEAVDDCTLNIRTSFLGLDPRRGHGLLQSAFLKKPVMGYENQLWSGATTLQFARACEFFLSAQNFSHIREKTGILNFCPLGPVSKYEILKTYARLKGVKEKVIRSKGNPVTRYLISDYQNLIFTDKFAQDLPGALAEMIAYEKT